MSPTFGAQLRGIESKLCSTSLARDGAVRSTLLVLVVASGVAHADRLVDVRQVVRGDYLAPRIAPDGRDLLLTGPQLRGLYLAPISGAPVRRLTEADEAGVQARWTADGTIAYRALAAGARRDLAIDRS